MKQITLEHELAERPLAELCTGKLIFVWALYGYATALLWRLAGFNPWLEAVVWAIALVAGITLASGMGEL